MLAAAILAAHAELIYRIALGVLGVALAISAVTDLRSRLIYNVVTLPALALELLLIFLSASWDGLEAAGIGLAICAGPFVLASLKENAIGMGDLKLMAVVGVVAGAAGGWQGSMKVVFYIALAMLLNNGSVLLYARIRKRERPKYVPLGAAIAAGTLAAWLFN